MTVDPDNPPVEVWHITLQRIREGLGIQRLLPREDSWWFSGTGNARFYAYKCRHAYWTSDCFATKHGAWMEAVRLLRNERERVTESYHKSLKQLRAAEQQLEQGLKA
jgi:hypothetical protein